MSVNSEYARNVSQIMANSAAARAEAQRRSGEIWGQTLSNVGKIASDTITQIPKIKEQERLAKEDQQLRDLFSSDQMPSPSAIIKAVGPERGSKIINGLASLKGEPIDPQAQFEKTQKVLRNVILGMNAIPDDLRGQAYPSVRQSLIQRGVIKPEDAPEQYDPAWWAQTSAYGQEPADAKGPKLAQITTIGADGQPVTKFVEEKAGAEYPQVPKSQTDKAAAVGSFEDYVTRTYGEHPTSEQILKARKDYQQSDDRPPVTVRMGNGMTPGQAFAATRQLRNDYERETKAAQTVQQQLSLMESSLGAVKKGQMAAGSQGVLVTFQKILDPTSVVRESEYARSASGMSLLSQIEGKWTQITKGGAGVKPDDLEQFVQLSRQFAKNQRAFAEQSRKQIDAIASEYGLKPEHITRDIAAPDTEAPATNAPNTTIPGFNYQDYLKSKGK
jgi:hypothetical protein